MGMKATGLRKCLECGQIFSTNIQRSGRMPKHSRVCPQCGSWGTLGPTEKHGIYIIEHKRWNTKQIWNAGHLMAVYLRQPKKICFEHSMVNDCNQNHCGGWHIFGVDISEEALLKRVLDGQKPFADVTTFGRDKLKELRKWASGQPHIVVSSIMERHREDGSILSYHFCICQDKTLGRLFDLDVLVRDYAAGGIVIHPNPEKRLSDYFDDWDYQDEGSRVELWETGLILGYPVENTISLYLSRPSINVNVQQP